MTETPETYDALTDDEKKRILNESMGELERKFWLDLRQAWLGMAAAVEERLGITPTTAEYRKIAKGKM